MVKLIGVNKGRHVTLKYFNILIKVTRKHRSFEVKNRNNVVTLYQPLFSSFPL